MKQSLTLQQRQQLRMSPELRQAIHLMQLSSLELSQELQVACESNALLEWGDAPDVLDDEPALDEPTPGEDSSYDLDPDSDEYEHEEMHSQLQSLEDLTEALHEDPSVDLESIADDSETDWSEMRLADGGATSEGSDASATHVYSTTLADHLLRQLALLDLATEELSIAKILIEHLDDNGYLRASLAQVERELSPEVIASGFSIESVLGIIQKFSPTGVGARNVRECLLIQLRETLHSHPQGKLALDLVEKCFDAIPELDFSRMQQKTQAQLPDLESAVELVRSLNPRPGAAFAEVDASYIIPDVYVRKIKGEWVVDINDDAIPRVHINDYYKQLMNDLDSRSETSFLRKQYREARSILLALDHRKSTLLRTASAIVAEQQGFFERGESSMRPLLRSDIARMVGVHESTISRISSQKYLDSPRGIFEFAYFFSSHVHTLQGNEISSRAIKAFIRKLTDEENPKRPLSDNAIASLLLKKDIRIARRTVAKYRESMSIPPSKLRQVGL